jgi:hypothetical protein
VHLYAIGFLKKITLPQYITQQVTMESGCDCCLYFSVYRIMGLRMKEGRNKKKKEKMDKTNRLKGMHT